MIDSSNETLMMENLSWTELSKLKDRCFILPVGAIEQHGPHLPLGTDTIIPLEIAIRVADATKSFVMSPVHYGCASRPRSGGGRGFPVHASVSAKNLMGYVEDILADMIRHEFRKILVLSWHYENSSFLYETVDTLFLRGAPSAKIVLICEAPNQIHSETMNKIFPDGFPGWDVEHSSILETSLMMALKPRLVDTSKLVDGGAKRSISYDIFPAPADIISESGVLFRSTPSSAEKGKLALDDIVNGLISVVKTEFQ